MSGSMITKVRRQDREVVSSALRKLGTSEIEELLYRGIIFVEGPDDIMILEAGFEDILRRLKLKDLGGRLEVERQIELLQSDESTGGEAALRCFIFDRDDAPSSLKSTKTVRVLQWPRRCLENYLLDINVIADLLMDKDVVNNPLKNMGEVTDLLKSLAFAQLTEKAAREEYIRLNFGDVGFRANEIKGKSLYEITNILFGRLNSMKRQMDSVFEGDWKKSFENSCTNREEELRGIWEATWLEDCDGKRLFQDISSSVTLRMSVKNFKKRVIERMRMAQSENWRSVKSLLSELTSTSM